MIHQRLMDGGVMHGYLRLEAAAQGIMKRGGGGGSFKLLNYANWGLHSLAQVCLLLLTNVSSSDNLLMHEGGFVGFLVFSMLHKGTCVYLFRWAHWHDLERVPHIRCGGARTTGCTEGCRLPAMYAFTPPPPSSPLPLLPPPPCLPHTAPAPRPPPPPPTRSPTPSTPHPPRRPPAPACPTASSCAPWPSTTSRRSSPATSSCGTTLTARTTCMWTD
jgi:hypothetical protein